MRVVAVMERVIPFPSEREPRQGLKARRIWDRDEVHSGASALNGWTSLGADGFISVIRMRDRFAGENGWYRGARKASPLSMGRVFLCPRMPGGPERQLRRQREDERVLYGKNASGNP